jgi:hypothetical protein
LYFSRRAVQPSANTTNLTLRYQRAYVSAAKALDREQRSLGLFKTAAVAANVVFAAASERP